MARRRSVCRIASQPTEPEQLLVRLGREFYCVFVHDPGPIPRVTLSPETRRASFPEAHRP